MGLVVPAVLPSSREDLEEKLAFLLQIPDLRRVQIDVVDGRFASPASWPYSAPGEDKLMVQHIGALPAVGRIEYEIDLMCTDAEAAAAPWLSLGATRLTFHAESTSDLPRLIKTCRSRYGDVVSFGLALNIGSDLTLLEPCLAGVEYVQFMGIATIGRQGQAFDRRVIEKLRIFHARHPTIPMQVDGGITLQNARQLIALEVSNIVVGSAIVKASDPAKAFEAIESPFGV